MAFIVTRRKQMRMPGAPYDVPDTVWAITATAKRRAPIFAKPGVAAAAVAILQARADAHRVVLHAFCVMPDHVHIVMSPSASIGVSRFVGEFKNLAQREAWRLGIHGAFWQPSFFDHAVRSEEDLLKHASYVVENPVRAGLVARWVDWPHSGSRFHAR